jgi:hypothetical protein
MTQSTGQRLAAPRDDRAASRELATIYQQDRQVLAELSMARCTGGQDSERGG